MMAGSLAAIAETALVSSSMGVRHLLCEIGCIRFGDPLRDSSQNGFGNFRDAINRAHPGFFISRPRRVCEVALHGLGDESLEGDASLGGGGFHFAENRIGKIDGSFHKPTFPFLCFSVKVGSAEESNFLKSGIGRGSPIIPMVQVSFRLASESSAEDPSDKR